jgi:hypothetical protein
MAEGTDQVRYRRNLAAAALPTLAVPIAIGLVMLGLGLELETGSVLAGAVGWMVALILRAPVAIAAMRATEDRERAQPWITGSSGPLEELVRLAVVLVVGRDLSTAAAVGLGWAAIEVVYSLVNGVAMLALLGRDDPEAEQARALMPIPAALEPSAPWWGVLERAWASLMHIGFTLIVAAHPVLVIVTMIAHSATNLGLLRGAARTSLARFEIAGTVLGVVILGVGVALWIPR